MRTGSLIQRPLGREIGRIFRTSPSVQARILVFSTESEYSARSESQYACYSHCYVARKKLSPHNAWSQGTLYQSASVCLIQAKWFSLHRHICNEFTYFCTVQMLFWLVAFPIYGKVIAIESMVTRARLRYTRDHLTSGICSLIKPAALAKFMQISAIINTFVLW